MVFHLHRGSIMNTHAIMQGPGLISCLQNTFYICLLLPHRSPLLNTQPCIVPNNPKEEKK